ncbi:hypothetical protein C5167_050697 [Papaver somniferum]|uniref:2-oxoglutarate-dependent dioxygenase DAO n=1 Tax=Papaver somniferum TaxID=3469 RepID=A0A4Y7KTL4_PAPSO|nr:probable 2-oxoglutarate-dependent dioxygenase AOP1 [Papaver somniferum]RZC75215.1 hypothetical protein C5167_050697 [Papaver somniferum]
MDVERGIPCIDFSRDPTDLVEGSDGWKNLCDQVREACENYGCFQVVYDQVPVKLHEELLVGLKELFDLPDETKEKNVSSKPYHGYIGKAKEVPLYESLGVHNAPNLDQVEAFTNLMWPNGNPAFCQTLNSMAKRIQELEGIVRKMILQNLGVKNYYDSHIENSDSVFRVMKYKAPRSDDSAVGLLAHVDKNILTILYQDIQGLELLSKEGQWFRVLPKAGTLTVFAGEALMAWSNGRIHAAKHRVIMQGRKDRYSYAFFSTPKGGAVVEIPKELVDNEHPLLFRPFNYLDFLRYFQANLHLDNPLEIYAGAV